MPCAFQFFLSEKFDFCTHVLYRIFEGVLCDMRINIQSRTDLGVSHKLLFQRYRQLIDFYKLRCALLSEQGKLSGFRFLQR